MGDRHERTDAAGGSVAVSPEPVDALVVGSGPAGLMAAQMLARAGRGVIVCDSQPSPGRKLLMAGKSGLNLTMDAPLSEFAGCYFEGSDWLAPMLGEFGPAQVQDWARGLGQAVFTGSSGRVFPVVMKASPLLRAWLSVLRGQGATLRMRWRLRGMDTRCLHFDTPDGPRSVLPRVAVLALGGASWSRLGADGAWTQLLAAHGVPLAPFQPANMGLCVAWSGHMAPWFGHPVKSLMLCAGSVAHRGECVISARGLEGSGIYAVSRAIRSGAPLVVDLFPDLTAPDIARRLALRPLRESLSNRLRKALGLQGARMALVQEFGRPLPARDPLALARLLKALAVRHQGPRPMDEAISVAGGVRQDAVDRSLMLRACPGVFVAGEMLDWEAPTGGYLITGCLATGRWAGRAAAAYAARQDAAPDCDR